MKANFIAKRVSKVAKKRNTPYHHSRGRGKVGPSKYTSYLLTDESDNASWYKVNRYLKQRGLMGVEGGYAMKVHVEMNNPLSNRPQEVKDRAMLYWMRHKHPKLAQHRPTGLSPVQQSLNMPGMPSHKRYAKLYTGSIVRAGADSIIKGKSRITQGEFRQNITERAWKWERNGQREFEDAVRTFHTLPQEIKDCL